MNAKENMVKTGKVVLDTFFQNINSIAGIDTKIANTLLELYKEGKFTENNVVRGIRNTINFSLNGKSMLLYGENASGKSSFTDSYLMVI